MTFKKSASWRTRVPKRSKFGLSERADGGRDGSLPNFSGGKRVLSRLIHRGPLWVILWALIFYPLLHQDKRGIITEEIR